MVRFKTKVEPATRSDGKNYIIVRACNEKEGKAGDPKCRNGKELKDKSTGEILTYAKDFYYLEFDIEILLLNGTYTVIKVTDFANEDDEFEFLNLLLKASNYKPSKPEVKPNEHGFNLIDVVKDKHGFGTITEEVDEEALVTEFLETSIINAAYAAKVLHTKNHKGFRTYTITDLELLESPTNK